MRRVVLVLAVAAPLALAAAGVAWAQTPITVSEHHHKDTDRVTAYLPCQGEELYNLTITYNELIRVTAAGIDEEGTYFPPLHFHHSWNGKLLAVPVDGTGPSFTGHARDTETYNAKSFEEFVGPYSNDHRVIAKGSDGSRINFHLHVHTTVNAKGEVTSDLFKVRPDPSCITPSE